MNFGGLENFWFVLLLPLGVLLGVFRGNTYEARLSKTIHPSLLPAIGPSISNRRRRSRTYTYSLTLILSLLVFAALRPEWGFQWQESRRHGGDIVLAIDVSESMLATDISPSRLERAKRKVNDLLEILKGDRVALVAFSGIAFVETPLTLDYAAFRQFLPLVKPDLIPIKGSNLELAMRKSLEALGVKEDSSPEIAKGSAIILFTDGEELDGNLASVGELASRAGVRIYVLGIGTIDGAPIQGTNGYKKDKEGKVVITKLRPDILEQVATLAGGTYIQSISTAEDIRTVYQDNLKRSLKESDRTMGNTKRWNEYYQLPLGAAICLLIFLFWGQFRPRKGPYIALLLVMCFPHSLSAQTNEELGFKAKQEYDSGNYTKAEEMFHEGSKRELNDSRYSLGLGASQYRQGRFQDAQATYAQAAAHAKTNETKGQALYNLGNSLVQNSQYKEAVEAYEQSQKLIPHDKELAENLAYAKRLLELQKQQQKSQDKKQENKQQKSSQQNSSEEDSSQEGSSHESQSEEQKSQEDARKNEALSTDASSQSSDTSRSDSSRNSSAEMNPSDSSLSSANPQADSGGSSAENSSSMGNLSNEQSSDGGEGSSKSEIPSENKGESSSNSSTSEASQDSGGQSSSVDQNDLDTLINGVEEKYDANTQYRVKKALQQMKAEKRKLPEKDW